MKLPLPVLFIAIIISGCNATTQKTTNNGNRLVYLSAPSENKNLSAAFDVSADPEHNEITIQAKLSNTGDTVIDLEELAIATDEGIRSLPVKEFKPFSLATGKDTTLSLKYNPTNSLKLFQTAGLAGYLKDAYHINVAYKLTGNDNLLSLTVPCLADKKAFMTWAAKYKKAITGYSFNTTTGFNEAQEKYLESLKQIKKPPFVYLSDQEIAVAGLNFRMKSYYQADTLHAELAIVNHADFPVKIIPDSLDITAADNSAPQAPKIITIEKIAGSQQDIDMMEKGDRILLHFKKHMVLKQPGNRNMVLHIRKAFVLTGKHALFNVDAGLIPKQF